MAACWPSKPPAIMMSPRYFDYLPVGLFAGVMGLCGLSIAWKMAAAVYGAPSWIAVATAVVAAAAFILLAIAYLAKASSAPDAVRAEFQHPLAGNLFGTIPISLLLLPMLLPSEALWVARALWAFGAAGMLGFAWLIVRRWMTVRQHVEHATPAWIVPVVGVLDVPLAVPHLGLPQSHGLMVACLAVGLFFAIPLFTMIFSRLLFEEPMAPASQSSLLILVAPFAVGLSAYVAVTGRVDLFAEGLYGLMLFILTILLERLRYLPQCCPFRVAWWAVSFPLAACAGASITFAQARPGVLQDVIAVATLGLASVVIAGLLVRTVVGILRGEMRQLSG
ncbi:SLAC1 anion channel family protein [Sphingomonas sp. PB4P5]|uniref:SLAC1 anion channel family protein n=1 Tax=Parasphingomonas puruogangriensis TaxID=3096155 RepID=UPI002FC72AC6